MVTVRTHPGGSSGTSRCVCFLGRAGECVGGAPRVRCECDEPASLRRLIGGAVCSRTGGWNEHVCRVGGSLDALCRGDESRQTQRSEDAMHQFDPSSPARDVDARQLARATLTVQEAATILGISRSSAYELVRLGAIPSLRLGHRLVVPRRGLMQLINGPTNDVA